MLICGLCWIPSSSCDVLVDALRLPLSFCRVPQVPLGLWVRSGEGGLLWSPGGTRDASPGFPLFDFHLDRKTDTAACSDNIAHSSSRSDCRYSVWVSRRGSVQGKGLPRGCVCVFHSLSLRGPTGLGRGGGSVTLDRRGGQVIHISLGSTLLCWVIISQFGIENLKFLLHSRRILSPSKTGFIVSVH